MHGPPRFINYIWDILIYILMLYYLYSKNKDLKTEIFLNGDNFGVMQALKREAAKKERNTGGRVLQSLEMTTEENMKL